VFIGELAQMGERLPCKQEARGNESPILLYHIHVRNVVGLCVIGGVAER